MLRVLGAAFSKFAKRYLPDALIFAFLLTLITFVLGMIVQQKSPMEMIRYMGDGFWSLLSFAMQMCLVLNDRAHTCFNQTNGSYSQINCKDGKYTF
ncbi:MAG TPA: TIGR00366 family protein [Pseudothermotoga sp.]